MKRLYTLIFISLHMLSVRAVVGDTLSLEDSLKVRDDIIFFGGFEEGYNNNTWRSNWGIPWNNRAGENEVVDNAFQGGQSLRVNYPEGGVGPGETGIQFPIVLRDIAGVESGLLEEAYLRYYVKFEEGFDFRLGGKLPGLMGGGDSWGRSGGNQPDGTNGWTLRFMWRSGGQLVVYAYVPKSENGLWGEDQWGQDIDCGVSAIPGAWHCIEQYVNVGTPGSDDGVLKVWIDGTQVLDIDNMRFWDVENDNGKIGGIYFSTFHGGNTDEWGPLRDSHARFDGIVLAKERVGYYNKAPDALHIPYVIMPDGYAELPYRTSIPNVIGGTPPFRWEVNEASIPGKLAADTSGNIIGCFDEAFSGEIEVIVYDSNGDSARASGPINIENSDSINIANSYTLLAHSNNFSDGNPVSGMWDGDISGEPYASPGAVDVDSFWVVFDLGKTFHIDMIRLHGDAEGTWLSKYYTLKISKDTLNGWTKVVNDQDCFGNQWYETPPEDSLRFIYLSVRGDESISNVQIREFEVIRNFSHAENPTASPERPWQMPELSVQIFPNPAGNHLTIQLNRDFSIVESELFQMDGRKVASFDPCFHYRENQLYQVDLSGMNLKDKMYILRISGIENGRIHSLSRKIQIGNR